MTPYFLIKYNSGNPPSFSLSPHYLIMIQFLYPLFHDNKESVRFEFFSQLFHHKKECRCCWKIMVTWKYHYYYYYVSVGQQIEWVIDYCCIPTCDFIGRSKRGQHGNGTLPNWLHHTRLFPCMWTMLSLQEGDGELQVLHCRILPHSLPMHLQREILPCTLQLMTTICFFFFLI